MLGFNQGSKFCNRLIFFHLLSVLVVLVSTLIALILLIKANTDTLNTKHLEDTLQLNASRIIHSLQQTGVDSTDFLVQLSNIESLQRLCLWKLGSNATQLINHWPVNSASLCLNMQTDESDVIAVNHNLNFNNEAYRLTLISPKLSTAKPLQITLMWLAVLIISLIAMSFLIYSFSRKHLYTPLEHLNAVLTNITGKHSSKTKLINSPQPSFIAATDMVNELIYKIERQHNDLEEITQKYEETLNALEESESHFKTIFEQANEGIILLQRPSNRFYRFNDIACANMGYSRKEFAKLTIHEALSNATINDNPVDLRANIIPERFEAHCVTKQGSTMECQISAKDIHIHDADYRLLILHDVTQKNAIQRQLSALNSQLQAVLDASANIAIIAVNTHGIIQIFNRGAELILKYSRDEVLNKLSLIELMRECRLNNGGVKQSFEQMISALSEKSLLSQTCTLAAKDGQEVPVEQSLTKVRDIDGKLHGYLCIAQDLRERLAEQKRQSSLESQLQHSQKMETIGTLAGGIAHDLNNLLTPVMGYTEMLLEDTRDHPKHQKRLERVLNASLRAKELVKQILTFSHHIDHDPQPILAKEIIKEVLDLMLASLPANIQLVIEIEAENARINADVTKIHQVLMNLCTNAAHAIGSKQGKITIRLDATTIDESSSDIVLPAGEYVVITISDTGCGMPESVQKRIFEPFYTTKDIGEGTGLGLSVVHGIIRSHSGTLVVKSKVNQGSHFYVYLPFYQAEAVRQPDSGETLYGTNKHILFVDDDKPVLNLSEELLKRRGYQVDAYSDSQRALKAFKLTPEGYDVVITDQSMPNMTGTELATAIHQIRPEMPIILLTGLGLILDQQQQKQFGIHRVISKPVLSNDLIQVINEAVASSSSN